MTVDTSPTQPRAVTQHGEPLAVLPTVNFSPHAVWESFSQQHVRAEIGHPGVDEVEAHGDVRPTDVTGVRALRANAMLMARLMSGRHTAISVAREEGVSWDEIAKALRIQRDVIKNEHLRWIDTQAEFAAIHGIRFDEARYRAAVDRA